ncbi:hypothetical protein EMIT0357P_30523 [Pseudomonas marginalis]
MCLEHVVFGLLLLSFTLLTVTYSVAFSICGAPVLEELCIQSARHPLYGLPTADQGGGRRRPLLQEHR